MYIIWYSKKLLEQTFRKQIQFPKICVFYFVEHRVMEKVKKKKKQ
jgi:hypothetical protein